LQEWKSNLPENFEDESDAAALMVDTFEELAFTLANYDTIYQITPIKEAEHE
jgi:hypothetical protein